MIHIQDNDLQHRIDELNRTIDTLEERRDELKNELWSEYFHDGESGDGSQGHGPLDETGESVRSDPAQSDRSAKDVVDAIGLNHEHGAPTEEVLDKLVVGGEFDQDGAEEKLESLKKRGEVYEARPDYWRTT